jgi:exo-beta-1,3-glucanase (GH17 family)
MRTGVVLIIAFIILAFFVKCMMVEFPWHAPATASRLTIGEISVLPRHVAIDRSTSLRARLSTIRWVAYAPTAFNPNTSPPILPSDESIQADLAVLKEVGFDGLVTYGATFTSLPHIAEAAGFRGLLLGIWDPNDITEIEQAVQAAQSVIVVGIIVGNEGLMFRRYDLSSLRRAMDAIKHATGKPVSTTEVIESYMTQGALIAWSDFLVPNAHPLHHGIKTPRQAVEWTAKAFQHLVERAGGKPVLFKEVGLPTAGDDGLNEVLQAQYYALLRETSVQFVYFEAFDGPWKPGSVIESHWGLFQADRIPKLVARVLARLDRLDPSPCGESCASQ